jgi:hypothetical protein
MDTIEQCISPGFQVVLMFHAPKLAHPANDVVAIDDAGGGLPGIHHRDSEFRE